MTTGAKVELQCLEELGDPELVDELVEMFVALSAEQVVEMRNAIYGSDADLLRAQAEGRMPRALRHDGRGADGGHRAFRQGWNSRGVARTSRRPRDGARGDHRPDAGVHRATRSSSLNGVSRASPGLQLTDVALTGYTEKRDRLAPPPH